MIESQQNQWGKESAFWKGDWLKGKQIPKMLLVCSRKVPWIQAALAKVVEERLSRLLLGLEDQEPSSSGEIYTDVWQTVAWLEGGHSLSSSWLESLEMRAKESDSMTKIWAARTHVQASIEREMLSRQRLCSMTIPFLYPGEVSDLHVELFAGGEKALHVLHVELLRKLGLVLVESLEEDCRQCGMWLYPLIEVLPEKKFRKAIEQLYSNPSRKNQRLFKDGGWGLLATYAHKIGMEVEDILQHGTEIDRAFWVATAEMVAHRVELD